MLRSKKEKYIFIVLTLILLAAVVWRVSLHQMQKKSEPVRICVITAKDSEVKYGEIMAGIRDYARENQTEIRVLYQENLTVEGLTQMLSEKENQGIHGIFLLHPEDFFNGNENGTVTAELPVLRIGGADQKALSELAAISCGKTVQDDAAAVAEHLEPAEIQELLDGVRTSVEVVSEYQVGYTAVKTLAETSGKVRKNVTVDPLKLTAEDIRSGKYNSLLSE